MKLRIRQVRRSLGLTQAEFAKSVSLSRNFVAQIETGAKVPSERTIVDICREFNINPVWLRTGEGEMHLPRSRKEEVADFFGKVLSDEPDAFRLRMIEGLAKLSVEDWAHLANICEKMAKK